MNDERAKAVTINEKIKKVIVHLSGPSDRGTALHDVLIKLIDRQTFMNPLNSF